MNTNNSFYKSGFIFHNGNKLKVDTPHSFSEMQVLVEGVDFETGIKPYTTKTVAYAAKIPDSVICYKCKNNETSPDYLCDVCNGIGYINYTPTPADEHPTPTVSAEEVLDKHLHGFKGTITWNKALDAMNEFAASKFRTPAPADSVEIGQTDSFAFGETLEDMLVNYSRGHHSIETVITVIKNKISGYQHKPAKGEGKDEWVICAANYYNDEKEYHHQPRNIKEGFVTCGRRHHNCINTFAQIVGFPYSEQSKKLLNTEVQGFLTNTNRFVDRKTAYSIAFKANQIHGPNKGQQENAIGLTSEDLY